MSEWYHARGGERHGPVSLEEMQRLVREGLLGPDELAWRSGLPDWRPIRELPELHDGAAPAAAPPAAGLDPYSTPDSLAGAPPHAPGSFDFSRIWARAWKAFTESILFGLFTLLVLGGSNIVLSLIDAFAETQVLGIVFALFAGTALQAGAQLGAIRACRGQAPGMGTLLEPFRTSYLPLLAFALVVQGSTLIFMLVFIGGAFGAVELESPAVLIPLLLVALVAIWVSLRLYLVVPFIVDTLSGPVTAVKASWAVTRGRVLHLLGLGVVACAVMLAGLLLFLVGVIPATWLIICLFASAYVELSGND